MQFVLATLAILTSSRLFRRHLDEAGACSRFTCDRRHG
jgi:hypothetical protein